MIQKSLKCSVYRAVGQNPKKFVGHNYFTSRGSDVFVSFMDFSKVFDQISHFGLFLKLLRRGVPLLSHDYYVLLFESLLQLQMGRQI